MSERKIKSRSDLAKMVAFRMTEEEFGKLESQCVELEVSRSELVRSLIFERELPQKPIIPEINMEAWRSLARCSADLSRLTQHVLYTDGSIDDLAELYNLSEKVSLLSKQLVEAN